MSPKRQPKRRTLVRREPWPAERWDALRRFYDGVAGKPHRGGALRNGGQRAG